MRELRRGGEPFHVEPQVFDLLEYLLARRDRLVVSRSSVSGDLLGAGSRACIVAARPDSPT